ncbi:uncharacterized protein QC763_510770 [Podospora pseudopauciseta]|uniref:Peptidase metallopeptidase domain-containing protein n=1 Tax=Podospora pseudopauciseta TaxID=2093780 RepID=A0ABR0HBB0_9PEZI|nr:hypothetical protein QC763_510770 [Podospora pseudopauciseta]
MSAPAAPNDNKTEKPEREHVYAVTIPSLQWKRGEVIPTAFVNGTPQLQAKVKQHAQELEKHANFRFKFRPSEHGPARITIAMDPQLGSYSKLDTQSPVAAYNNPDNPTMNLRIDETTPDAGIRRTCMHELLHAIGFDHEHQSPAANIEWDEDAVYEEMAKSGWTREKTQQAQRAALKIRPRFNHDVPDPREPDKERVFQHSEHHAF